jgi:hypothetical protein
MLLCLARQRHALLRFSMVIEGALLNGHRKGEAITHEGNAEQQRCKHLANEQHTRPQLAPTGVPTQYRVTETRNDHGAQLQISLSIASTHSRWMHSWNLA